MDIFADIQSRGGRAIEPTRHRQDLERRAKTGPSAVPLAARISRPAPQTATRPPRGARRK